MHRHHAHYYWMVAPALFLFAVFHTFPVLQGIFYSLTNWQGYGKFSFVGLKNYINMLSDDRVASTYLFTLQFAIVSTVLVNVISLALAVGLNAKIGLRRTLRAIYFIPNILSILIVGYIFNYIFSNLVPTLFENSSIEALSVSILGNPKLAWIGVVIVSVWQTAALTTILYIAGLQAIPVDLFEAASIDGASRWQNFRHITLPLMVPFIAINTVYALKHFLLAFDQIIALTGGGPGRATELVSVQIYYGGFQRGEFAYQSANAVVFLVLIVVLSAIQLKVLQRRETHQ